MQSGRKLLPALHIGLPRTGTKTLQWHLYAKHPEVYYLGIFDGNRNHRYTISLDYCRDEHAQRMLKGIAIWIA